MTLFQTPLPAGFADAATVGFFGVSFNVVYASQAGIVADGVTDNQVLIQQILDRNKAFAGAKVSLCFDQPGVVVTGGNSVNSNTEIYGVAGATVKLRPFAYRLWDTTTGALSTKNATHVFQNANRSFNPGVANKNHHIHIHDLRIDGTGFGANPNLGGAFGRLQRHHVGHVQTSGGTTNPTGFPGSYPAPDANDGENGTNVGCIAMQGVDDLILERLECTNPATYCIQVSNLKRFRLAGLYSDIDLTTGAINQDFAHVNGNCFNGTILNCRGTSFDDFIGLNANDNIITGNGLQSGLSTASEQGNGLKSGGIYAANGPLEDILVDGVNFMGSLFGVRVLTTDQLCKRIRIKNLTGTVQCYAVVIDNFPDGSYGGVGNGKDISIDGVNVLQHNLVGVNGSSQSTGIININCRYDLVSLSNIQEIDQPDGKPLIVFGPGANVKSALINGLQVYDSGSGTATTARKTIDVVPGAVISNLSITGASRVTPNATPAKPLLNVGGTVSKLVMSNWNGTAAEAVGTYGSGAAGSQQGDAFGSVSGTGTGTTVGSGLMGYFKFDEAAGANAVDSTTNANTLTQSGGVGTGTGKIGTTPKGRTFVSASSQYLEAAAGSVFAGGSSFEFAGWFKLTAHPAGLVRLMGKWKESVNQAEWLLAYNGSASNAFGFYASPNGTGASAVSTGSGGSQVPLQAGNVGDWVFINGWFDGTSINLKVNNGTTVSAACSAVFGSTAKFRIGCDADNAGFTDMVVDGLRLYNRNLTPSERTEIYAAGVGTDSPY